MSEHGSVFNPGDVEDKDVKMNAAFIVGFDRGVQSGGSLILTGVLIGILVAKVIRR